MKKTSVSLVLLASSVLGTNAFAQSSSNEIAACNSAKAVFKSETRKDANSCVTKMLKSEGNLSHYSVKVSIQEITDFNELIILDQRSYKVQLVDGDVSLIRNLD